MNIPQVSRDKIVSLYCVEKLPMRVLAEMFSCSKASVYRRIKEEGIETRSLHDYPPTEKQREAWSRIGRGLTTEDRRINGGKNKGKPKSRNRKTGQKATEWEFGLHERKDKAGYILVYCPDHPHANFDGYVFKHRLVIERETGEYLSPDLVVHHINFKRDDNRIENLRVMTKREHSKLHAEERKKRRQKT